MITVRGLVRYFVLFIRIASTLLVAGCGEKDCVDKQVKYYEQVPVTRTNEIVQEEEYTYEQPSVELVCSRDFSYDVVYDDKFWLDDPVEDVPNQVKRTVYIQNHEDKIGMFSFDILYLQDGQVVERTLNPSETLVAAKGERRLFLAWNTEYSPGKDVKIDVIDAPQIKGEDCEKIVKYTNMTGVRNKTVSSEESVSYENVIKTKTVTVCN